MLSHDQVVMDYTILLTSKKKSMTQAQVVCSRLLLCLRSLVIDLG